MVLCETCDIEINDNNSFCTQCGNLISQTTNKEDSPLVNEISEQKNKSEEPLSNKEDSPLVNEISEQKNESEEPSLKTGKLVLPDDSEIAIDESQRIVGRADLKKFLESNPNDISRGHFTVYEEDNKYFLEDGITNVQYKPSTQHTILNDEDITGKGRKELKDGNTIKISDLMLYFKMD